MSRDQQAANGQLPWEPARCACGCLEPLHNLSSAGKRTGCSTSTCDCRAYITKEA